MPLEEYRQKRNFQQTPEPPGEVEAGGEGPLRFVVQKHQASHLHYDFRLELNGALLSWAVPHGPSLDPSERRLAMRTEDHPLSYRNFEGIIPEGSYGAGTVMVWDRGVYHVPGAAGRTDNERQMRRGLEIGHIHVVLEGEKLKGQFHLIRMKKDQEDWLLIKADDAYATQMDILTEDRSVESGLSMEEIRERAGEEQAEEQEPEPPTNIDLSRFDLTGAIRSPMPTEITPMAAQLADEPFEKPDWLYEIKWDGFRGVAEVHPGSAALYSRHQLDYQKEFPPVVEELGKLGFEAVLDGEVVVVDDTGRSDFLLLQEYRKTGQGTLVYYVFDLLYLEGYDLMTLPLYRRKEILRAILPDQPRIKYSDHVEGQGMAFYQAAIDHGMEGVMAKNKNSLYDPGVRSGQWLKIKTHRRQEAVVGGFTEPRGSRPDLGALLLGVYEKGKLTFIGHTGGGLSHQDLGEIKEMLKPLIRPDSPFQVTPHTNQPATWVQPELVCEVRFAEWTASGMMRQPVFVGWRPDKDPRDVHREMPVPVNAEPEPPHSARSASAEQSTTEEIDGREVSTTNLQKMYYPEDALTKGDVIEYYRAMARYILPYLQDRPLFLRRYPNGIHASSFFQKDVNEAPEWVRTVEIESGTSGDKINYIVCQDEATLVYVANLGAIELHPWNSRIEKLGYPDYLVFDLDPWSRPFSDVIEVALQFHQILEQIGAASLVKTSGQTGLHIFIPLEARYTYEQGRQFAALIARLVNMRLPEITSIERSPQKREGKMYLDVLQNRTGQALIAPYSLRPHPGAPVSTPLRWAEVRPGLDPKNYNFHTAPPRVAELGDLWKGVLGPGVDIQGSLDTLKTLWEEQIR